MESLTGQAAAVLLGFYDRVGPEVGLLRPLRDSVEMGETAHPGNPIEIPRQSASEVDVSVRELLGEQPFDEKGIGAEDAGPGERGDGAFPRRRLPDQRQTSGDQKVGVDLRTEPVPQHRVGTERNAGPQADQPSGELKKSIERRLP